MPNRQANKDAHTEPFVESLRACSERVKDFIKAKHETLLSLSQEAGRIILEEQSHTNLQFETDGRVDVIAESSAGQTLRIELKLISALKESKGRLLSAIRTTQSRLKPKRLTHLLILTLLRKAEADDERFIKVKEHCLLGIFVSKSELEKKNDEELATEIVEEVERHLEEGYEIISLSRAEFLESLKLEEQRMALERQRMEREEQTRQEIIQLKAENQELKQAIKTLDQKLSETQKQLGDILSLLKEKLKD